MRPPALARVGPVALALCLVAGTPACSGGGPSAAERSRGPTRAAQACRHRWAALADQLNARAGQTDASAQADRWNALSAGALYYASNATATDCGQPLTREHQRVAALEAYTSRLAGYDMPRQVRLLSPAVRHYLAAPLPKPARATAGPGHHRHTRPLRPPSKWQVRVALRRLHAAAPREMTDLAPAWRQAAAVDIGDPAQVRRAVAGLRLLAGDSSAYAECRQLLRLLRGAVGFGRH